MADNAWRWRKKEEKRGEKALKSMFERRFGRTNRLLLKIQPIGSSMNDALSNFVAPVASPFETTLSALENASKGLPEFGDGARQLVREWSEKPLSEIASRVSAEELASNQYSRRLWALKRALRGYLSNEIDAVFIQWLIQGIIFADPQANAGNMLASLALEHADKLMDILPGNPQWDAITCEMDFNPAAVGGVFAARLHCPSAEEEAQAIERKTGWAQSMSYWREGESDRIERAKKAYREQRQASRLIHLSDMAGRLKTLKDCGRGAAWLLHCLGHGDEPAIQRALSAGLRLDEASPEAVQRFLATQSGANPSRAFKADEFRRALQIERGGLLKFTKKEKEKLAALEQADLDARWRLWERAIGLGLPRVFERKEQKTGAASAKPSASAQDEFCAASEPSGLAQSDAGTGWVDEVFLVGQDLFASMIQEIIRSDGVVSPPFRRLWTRLCASTPWPQEHARKAGAAPDESAMAWSLRIGAVSVADWVEGEFMGSVSSGHQGAGNVGEVIQALSKKGEKVDLSIAPGRELGAASIPRPMGAVAWMLSQAENPVALSEGISAMGVDWVEKDPLGRTFAHSLLSAGSKKTVDACMAALDAMQSAAPGSVIALANAMDKDGATALHWAARALELPVMQKFVDFGADINARDAKGQTILHWAARKYGAKAEKKFVPVVEFLSDNGFDWAAVDQKGDTGVATLAKSGRQGAGKAVAQAEGAVMREELKQAATNKAQPETPASVNAQAGATETLKKRAGRRI